MSMRVQSGVCSSAKLHAQTSKLPRSVAKATFRDDFSRYQGGRRCRPAQDLGAALVGGTGAGAASGALVGGVVLGVPLLPIFGLGVITGVVGALAGGVVGGALGGVVGGIGGGITAARHAHIHDPEPRKLRRHIFSEFGVVPMRHHSARIIRHLEERGVLAKGGSRAVRHQAGIQHALRSVRIFGKPLTPSQTAAIKQIVQLQAARF